MNKVKKKAKKIIIDDTDEEVQEMIKTWDIVVCKFCGKSISMLTAIPINEFGDFICPEHKK